MPSSRMCCAYDNGRQFDYLGERERDDVALYSNTIGNIFNLLMDAIVVAYLSALDQVGLLTAQVDKGMTMNSNRTASER